MPVGHQLPTRCERLQAVDLNFYVLRKDGEYAGASLWGPRNGRGAQFAVAVDGREARQEASVYLLERK